jgi:hypothetical protein
MDPIWDSGVALILAAFMSTGFVMWGIGAFNPKLSLHGEHAAEVHIPEDEEQLGFQLHRTQFSKLFESIFKFLLNMEPMPKMGQPPYLPEFPLWRWIVLAIWAVWVVVANILHIVSIVPYPKWSNALKPPFKLPMLVNWLWRMIWFLLAFAWLLLVRIFALLLAIPAILIGGVIDVLANLVRFLTAYSRGVWQAALVSVIVIIVVFAAAMAPTGLYVEVTNDPGGSMIQNSIGPVNWPNLSKTIKSVEQYLPGFGFEQLGDAPIFDGEQPIEIAGEPAQFSKFTLLAIFIAITIISLAVVAGLLALFFYGAHHAVADVRANEPSPDELTPPEMVQDAGKAAGLVVRALRSLPAFFGNKG